MVGTGSWTLGVGAVTLVLGMCAGGVLGWTAARSTPAQVAPCAADVEQAPVQPLSATDVLAAPLPARRPAGEGALGALRADFCEAELAAMRRNQARLQVPWPDELGVAEPSRWNEVIERAIRECDLPFSLEQVECTEYPCVARIRTDPAYVAPDEGPTPCPVLQEAFGAGSVETARSFVSCPDGSLKDVEVLFAHDEDRFNDVMAERYERGEEFTEMARLMARRFDAAVSTAECE